MLFFAITLVSIIVVCFVATIMMTIRPTKVPNGWFINDMIIFNELDKRGWAAKGFVIEPPDLKNASNDVLNEFFVRVSHFLSTIRKPAAVQFQWEISSDYKNELMAYDKDTTELADNDWTFFARKQRFLRFWNLMRNQQLRREHLKLYISLPIESDIPAHLSHKHLKEYYNNILSSLENYFQSQYEMMVSIFGNDTIKITPMNNDDHFRHYIYFLNPSLRFRMDYDPKKTFDPEGSIQENCLLSDIVCNRQRSVDNDYGFYSDGYYHNMIALKRWPQSVYPGIFNHITGLDVLDYSITVNMRCLNVRDEIKKEEKAIERLTGDYITEKKYSLKTSIEKKQHKVDSLSKGFTYPYQSEILIHIWADSKEKLNAKTTAIKGAVNVMNSAQYWESSFPVNAMKLYLQTWPGWTWGNYDKFMQYSENQYMAMLLPLSATFTGHLKDAEAIYDGNGFNIVGMKNFINGTPQHAAMFGMTGAGKSAQIIDLLSQTECFYDYTCIIEEGLSYGVYTQTLGSSPIIVKPDGRMTLNYLDTQQLPLSKTQMKAATTLVAKMCGNLADEDRQNIRTAQIGQYVDLLYSYAYNDWKRDNEEQIPDVAKYYVAVSEYLKTEMTEDDDLIDAWTEYRDLLNGVVPEQYEAEKSIRVEKAQELLAAVSEEDISKAIIEDEFNQHIRNMAFAWFDTEHYPTHSQLYELMLDPLDGHNEDEIKHLATLVSAYCAVGGNNGMLFDGPTNNVNLKGKIAHFELGRLTSNDSLKTLAGFLINNYTRNHIMTLPRSRRKRYVFEEAGRILDIPGGEDIIAEGYAQMRKFNTWIISIVQQYSKFKQSNIRPVIMGNSRQLLLLKQVDRGDLDDLNQDIALPEVTIDNIMRYPSPEALPSTNRYSSLTYYHQDFMKPICGSIQNRCSPEMLYVASTTGGDYEKRARELKKSENIVEDIKQYARDDKSKAEPGKKAA